MSPRLSSIIGWTCAILVAAFNLFAAVMKLIPVTTGSPAEEFGRRLGTAGMEYPLAVLELVIIGLFLLPRTSTVGLVLMAGYLGGALATNLTHGFSSLEALPIYILLVLLAISGWFRNPEINARLLKRPAPSF
ncbi:MAG: DoxX family protein [Candidatus Peregrinibacteria bacterium Greene0416_19]|nr:MAG: DoxX family protein [Candidatus Peregrinibacteria bacterium Greene0416_19]